MINRIKLLNNQNITNVLLLKKLDLLIEKEKNYNIILSNEYYWRIYKKIDNISLKQAKKMAYSIFFKFIPNIENMEFLVFEKEKNEFLFIAYNEKEIIENLKEKGFDLNKINKISFFQFLDIDNNECLRINENYIVENKENIISLIKNNKVECYALNIDNIKILNYVNIKSLKNNIEEIDKTTKYSFFIVNIFLFLFLIFSIYNNIKINKSIIKFNEFLLKENNLPNSMIQLNSISTKYKNFIEKKQNIKELFEILSFLNLANFNIEIVENSFNIDILLKNKEELINKITKEFNNRNIINYKIENNIIKVEI